METTLPLCPCGGTPVLQPSANRVAKREAAAALLAEATKRFNNPVPPATIAKMAVKAAADMASTDLAVKATAVATLKEIELSALGTRRGVEMAKTAHDALAKDVVEVCCQKCGAFVWHDTENDVVNRWNRAVVKLATLKPCCKAATDRRVDHDGMALVRCAECGVRHFTLEPQKPGAQKPGAKK